MNEFYELKINNFYVWTKHNDESGIYFIKEKCEDFTLLLEKIMPYKNGYLYIDYITGRQVVIKESNNATILIPSGLTTLSRLSKIPKEEILQKAFSILDNDELSYLNKSEDLLYNSYFCEIICKRDNIDAIPISLVTNEIEKHKGSIRKRIKSA